MLLPNQSQPAVHHQYLPRCVTRSQQAQDRLCAVVRRCRALEGRCCLYVVVLRLPVLRPRCGDQAGGDGVKTTAPLMRSATPIDVVEAALGLLRTRYATGQILVVDGGLTLVR